MDKARTSKIDATGHIATGAQTVDRACDLLRALALSGSQGARMTDLCDAAELNRPTVHRILKSLQNAGLVQQFQESRRYALASGMYELGIAAPNPVPQFRRVREVVEDLANETGDTVYLMLRRSPDLVCSWVSQGAYPIRPTLVPLGSRRPLVASMAGMAMLGALPEADANDIIMECRDVMRNFCRMSVDDVQRLVADARQQGFSSGTNAVIDGISAVGMAVPSRYGLPYMAMSVSAIPSRLPKDRVKQMVRLLRASVARISDMTSAAA